MMTQRVRTPEKNSCGQSRHEESCQFAPRGFARRREDSELDGRRQASPYSDFSFAKVSLFRPVQAKLAAARGGEEQEEDAASSEEWFDEDVGAAEPVQAKPEPNQTGMPDRLKAGIEMLSGIDMSDVRVHANSPKPARLNALAYTQGNQIYVGPGQERHLSHEAWHAVQQKEGKVQPNKQLPGAVTNNCVDLEIEASTMGQRAATSRDCSIASLRNVGSQLSHNKYQIYPKVIQLTKHNDSIIFRYVNLAKENIYELVHRTYGEPKDIPTETDVIAKSLNTFQRFDEKGNPVHEKSRNCAAFVSLDDDQALIAFNQTRVRSTQSYMSAVNPLNTDPNVALPCNMQEMTYKTVIGESGAHAECTLADELIERQKRGDDPVGTVYSPIGISQPCCMLCAAVMAVLGFSNSVRGYHTKNVTNWVCPDAIKNNNDNLKIFLGIDVYNQIEHTSNNPEDFRYNIDRTLQLLSQNSNNWDKVRK